jgi:hypothetical protein
MCFQIEYILSVSHSLVVSCSILCFINKDLALLKLQMCPLQTWYLLNEAVILLCTAFEDADDSSAESELPEWLMEVPEDLDVCIAQRHFEEAYNLLERAREFLDKNTATDPVITDIRYASQHI